MGPYQRGRDGRLRDPETGAIPTAIQRLHAEIAQLHPDGKLDQPGVLALDIGNAVLDQAWDPKSDRLLDRSVYELVLSQLKPTARQRRRVMQLYNAASGATVKAWNEREEQAKRRQAQLRTAERMLKAIPLRNQPYLAHLSTEQQFMNHVRSLRKRGGLSLRAIADRMAKMDQLARSTAKTNQHAARSATTLHTILSRDTVPDEANVMRTLLGVIIAALPAGEFGGVQDHQVLEDHLAAWRKLIDVREGANQRPEVVQTIIDALTMFIDVAESRNEPEVPGLYLALRAAELAGDGHELDDIKGLYQLSRMGYRLKVPDVPAAQ